MKLTDAMFTQIERWVRRNGRVLENALWDYHFHDGSNQGVMEALAAYQNPDGGFGHGLDADGWNPLSSPAQTSKAINVLHDAGLANPDLPICQGIRRYLASGDGFENGLWQFSIPSNDRYPHSPWYKYSEEGNALENFGLSACIAPFALDAFSPGEPVYEAAAAIAAKGLERLMGECQRGEMELGGYFALLPHWFNTGASPQAVIARLGQLVSEAVVTDQAQWDGYVPRPSRYVFGPESPFYSAFREACEAECDFLLRTLPENDVWPLNWSWFDTQARFSDAFAVASRWAKAEQAMAKVRFLRAMGR